MYHISVNLAIGQRKNKLGYEKLQGAPGGAKKSAPNGNVAPLGANVHKYPCITSETVLVLAHIFSGLRKSFQVRKADHEGETHAQTREC